MVITSQGFRFLLQDMQSQIWTLILQYLRMVERLNMALVDVLHFLFRLGTLEPGVPCSVASLTPTQSRMLEDLAGFGILYTRKGYFYPTRLASCLTSGKRGSWAHFADVEDAHGYILVETNFRVYAYTRRGGWGRGDYWWEGAAAFCGIWTSFFVRIFAATFPPHRLPAQDGDPRALCGPEHQISQHGMCGLRVAWRGGRGMLVCVFDGCSLNLRACAHTHPHR
jgi:hypothetical protein